MNPKQRKTLETRIARLEAGPLPGDLIPLFLGAHPLGRLSPDFAAAVRACSGGLIQRDGAVLRIEECGDDGALSERFAALVSALRRDGWFGAWRDELFAVRSLTTGDVLFRLERGTFRRFGLQSEASHLNAWTGDGRMWVARRAMHKAIDPGCLDNLVGGGIGWLETPFSALLRECAEEAGMDATLACRARPAGTLHALRVEGEGIHDERLHIFDLIVPDDFEPSNCDGEVAAFMLMTRDEVTEQIVAGAFTEDAAAVAATALLQPDASH